MTPDGYDFNPTTTRELSEPVTLEVRDQQPRFRVNIRITRVYGFSLSFNHQCVHKARTSDCIFKCLLAPYSTQLEIAA